MIWVGWKWQTNNFLFLAFLKTGLMLCFSVEILLGSVILDITILAGHLIQKRYVDFLTAYVPIKCTGTYY